MKDSSIIKLLKFHYISSGYRNLNLECTTKGSLTFCQKCQHSDQCKKPYWCCPMSRLCIKKACSDCRDHEWAKCWPFCRDSMNPKDCTCKNTKFPSKWGAPTCQGQIRSIKMLILALYLNIYKVFTTCKSCNQ